MLRVDTYDDADEFAAGAMPFLCRNEPENNLPIGILASIRTGQYQDPPPYLALATRDGEVAAAVVRTPPHRALVSFTPGGLAPDVLTALVADLVRRYGDGLAGVTADTVIARAFAREVNRATGLEVRRANEMRIYALNAVTDRSRPRGTLRRITEEDRDRATRWLRSFSADVHEPVHAADEIEHRMNEYLTANPDHRGLLLFEHDGRPVSMVGYGGPTPSGIRIGSVYTPVEHRRRGFASAAVAELSRRLIDD
jgi:predicted GNAT family acetyltransferase